MTSAELHAAEATMARAKAAAEVDDLRRLLWIQLAVGIVIALLVYAQFDRVAAVNGELLRTKRVLASESQATVLSFIINHADERSYIIRPSEEAIAVRRLVAGAIAINGLDASETASGSFTLGEVHRMATQRPATIPLTLPYLDRVQLPVSFPMLSLGAGVLAIIGNLFVLMRQRNIEETNHYADLHFRAALALVESLPIPVPPPFRSPVATEPWAGKHEGRIGPVLQVMSGLLDARVADRSATLLEFGAGALSVLIVLSLFGMGVYLSVEVALFHLLPTLLLPLCLLIGAGVAFLVCGIGAVLVRRIFRGTTGPDQPAPLSA